MESTSTITEAFSAIFADDFSCDRQELTLLGETTYDHFSIIKGILRPRNTKMVQQAIRVAQKVGAKLAPFSKGKNWGWGSRAAHVDHVILVDLSNMRKIIDYSEELGYITIQPGVSIKDVVAFLDERASNRILPMGGTTPEASLIGHMCERGISVGTLYHDRASHVCALEAVLGDAQIVHTGMRRYQHNSVSATHRWGPGPSLESLLSQSDMAIITEATIWLPTGSKEAFALLAASNDLEGLVNTLRDCESQGLRIASQIYNRSKVEKLFFARAQPEGLTLPPGDWVAISPVYPSSPLHAEADKAFLNDQLKQVKACYSAYLPLDDSFGPFNGRPYKNDEVLLGMLYRWGEPQKDLGLDPQRDKCGILWGCYAAPLVGSEIRRACNIINDVISAHGFEVFQAIHNISERACLLFPQLSYPDIKSQEAAQAIKELSHTLHQAGFPPYRVPAGLGGVPKSRDEHDVIIKTLRNVMDPKGVFAKGKYTAI